MKMISHIGGVLCLFLCLSIVPASAGDLDQVRLAIGFIPHIQFAPLYVGIEKGFYEQEGIELSIEYGFGIDIFSLLVSDKIDIGLSDADQLIIAGEKGMGLKAVFQYYQQYPVTILAKRGKVSQPADYAGKTIGTPQLFGTSYIGLLLFLDHFGLTGNVKIERIGYTQIASLLTDKVDGVVCFYNNEPLSSDLENVATLQTDVKDVSDVVGASFISAQATIDSKAELLTRFVRATQEAIAYTCQNQEDALSLSLEYIGPLKEDHRDFALRVLAATCDLFETEEAYGHLDIDKYTLSIWALARLGLIPRVYRADEIIHFLISQP